jgi:hypothetical protein
MEALHPQTLARDMVVDLLHRRLADQGARSVCALFRDTYGITRPRRSRANTREVLREYGYADADTDDFAAGVVEARRPLGVDATKVRLLQPNLAVGHGEVQARDLQRHLGRVSVPEVAPLAIALATPVHPALRTDADHFQKLECSG